MSSLFDKSRARVYAAIFGLPNLPSSELQETIQCLKRSGIQSLKINSSFTQANAIELLRYPPPRSIITVDNTAAGIAEGIKGKHWVIAFNDPRNKEVFKTDKAHYVIESLADLPEIIDAINSRLNQGDSPIVSPVFSFMR